MPVHDWSRVGAGIFHHFHQRWMAAFSDCLNDGRLPPDHYALAEQVDGPEHLKGGYWGGRSRENSPSRPHRPKSISPPGQRWINTR